MKRVLFSVLVTINCLASQILPLKKLASDSYVVQFTEEELIVVAQDYPDLWCMLAERYLLKHGYLEEVSIDDPGASIYMKSVLQEEETAFFGEGEEEGYYRPTRCSKNPFLLEKSGQFAYTYQESYQLGRGHFLNDQISKQQLRTRTLSDQKIEVVGPTKQGNFAVLSEQEGVFVCTFKYPSPKKCYSHSYKDNEGAVSGNNMYSWYDKKSWEEYEEDQPTALTMDEEIGCFYGGTQSGKLHCYSWFINVDNEDKIEWHGFTFPVSLDKKIDDIELSLDGSFLWVLSENLVYMYQFLGNKLTVMAVLPFIPSDDLVDTVLEKMTLVRLTPDKDRILLGGTRGTVLIADVKTGHSFILTKFKESLPIADMWWQEDTVVLLSRAGKLRKGKVRLADAETFFNVEE